jgi:colanic acid biosynthesis glycosyl transferase WcaI
LKILFIVPHYPPDLGPSAPLFALLSNELIRRGHSIYILTTVPHYPSGKVPKIFRKKFIQRTIENDIEIFRIRVPSLERSNLAGRLLQFVFYQIGATWAGLSINYDVVFVANPALWVWLPFSCLCVVRRKPSIFSIYDVYPDVGIQTGIFKSKFIINAVTVIEKFCLNHSTIVRIISDSFKPSLSKLEVPDSKMKLIYDWVDTNLIRPYPKKNLFSTLNEISDYFVVLYAGNIGFSQGLKTVLDAAEKLLTDKEILFVFVGEGSAKKDLLNEVAKLGLSNIKFLPFQPRENLTEVLASADISLVVLKKGIGFASHPSKILSILASNRPIIASIDEGCEGWNLIQKAKAGLCIPPEDPDKLADAILTLKHDKDLCNQKGNDGRKWVIQNHSPEVIAEEFEYLFESIIAEL